MMMALRAILSLKGSASTSLLILPKYLSCSVVKKIFVLYFDASFAHN